MGLTSLTLLAVSALVAAVAAGAVCLLWTKLAGRRRPLRVLGVLVAEALLLFTFGLVVNKAGEFYPSWAALTIPATPVVQAQPPAQRADSWFAAHPGDAGLIRRGLPFPWRAPDADAWGLSAAPEVFMPAAVLDDTMADVPVTVVVMAYKSAAPPVPQGLHSAVVVVRLGSRPNLPALATALPGRLGADLPVLRHSWAVVGVGGAAGAANAILAGDPAVFRTLALVPTGAISPGPAPQIRQAQQFLSVPSLDAALRWADREAPADLAPGYLLGGGLQPERPGPAQKTAGSPRKAVGSGHETVGPPHNSGN